RQINERLLVDDPGGDAGKRLADRARLVAALPQATRLPVRHVDDGAGRELGAAVAFEDGDAELLLELLGQGLWQLLGAGQQNAQRLEVPGLAALEIRAQKRRRRQEDRALVLAAELADLARLQRIDVIDRRGADLEGNPERDSITEAVEERQDTQQ